MIQLNDFNCTVCYVLMMGISYTVGSLTAEIGPIFGRKLNVRFTFFVRSTFEKNKS